MNAGRLMGGIVENSLHSQQNQLSWKGSVESTHLGIYNPTFYYLDMSVEKCRCTAQKEAPREAVWLRDRGNLCTAENPESSEHSLRHRSIILPILHVPQRRRPIPQHDPTKVRYACVLRTCNR